MSNSGDLEVIYCYPHPKTWQGLFSRHFISANLCQQRKLVRLSCLPASTPTCSKPRINTDPDNQRKPSHRTICVAVDLTAAFDTVNHNVLLSKIVRPTLPEATYRWLSNYIRGRQSVTSCRGVNSKAMMSTLAFRKVRSCHHSYAVST